MAQALADAAERRPEKMIRVGRLRAFLSLVRRGRFLHCLFH